jgi:DNA processing protein
MSDRISLALQRASFLRSPERYTVYDSIGGESGEKALRELSRDDLGRLLGRNVRSQQWNPDELLKQADRDLEYLEQQEIGYFRPKDERMPAGLTSIYDPPFVLFYRGNLDLLEKTVLSVVGTRKPTQAGLAAAFSMGAEARAYDVPVASGLARGIDTAGHRGAVSVSGGTIAVLGSGIDYAYPSENRALYGLIIERGGLVLSEYPPGTEPHQHHFPERNRIISGLAKGVVVVEAPQGSGALITADYALDQGRDVFVHQAGMDSEQGEGVRGLANDGAPIVARFSDVLEAWGMRSDSATSAGDSDSAGASLVGASEPRSTQQTGRSIAADLAQELGEVWDEN